MSVSKPWTWPHIAKKWIPAKVSREPIMRYEYKCPYCGYINVRTHRTARVVCSRCGRAFRGEP